MSTLRPCDFNAVRTLVHDATGIVIEPDKAYLVETRLDALLRTRGAPSVAALLEDVEREPKGELRRKIVEAIANGETQFFRDIPMFEMLRTHLLPRLIAQRAAAKKLVIWSAACSTGQEPYSLAMLLEEHFPELRSWDVKIFATDFSEEHLSRARAGRYSQYEINRGLPAAKLVRWFQKQGDEWVLDAALKQRVQLMPINLVTDWPPAFPIDLVLLRNVMIYWHVETKQSVLERVRRAMAPRGALVLGAAETTLQLDERYQRVAVGGASYYELPLASSLAPSDPSAR